MKKIIDLHTHSTASDGTMSPTELVQFAAQNGISALALTDHDSIDGVGEFFLTCEKYGVEPVAGVEISTKYKTELHIVGLFVDCQNDEFCSRLAELKNSRGERNKKLLGLLRENGFDISDEDVIGQKDGGTAENTGRAHIALAMVKKGYVADVQEAFERYLKKGAPFHVSRKTCTPEEAIQLIKNAGGLSILAHPVFISEDRAELSKLLGQLKTAGLDGMECYYSEHTAEYKDMCIELCDEFDLLVSGGSDFHADNKPHVKIGKVCGSMDIPYNLLEKMKKRKGIL